MIVPDLSPEIRELKARARRFVEEELYPAEQRIVERGDVDEDEVEALREKARAEGFSNYNLPSEHGGADLPMLAQVAIEEEAGRATNGLGFIVAERGPREILELATPDQMERFIGPLLRHETYEAWAITEPDAAGSDVAALEATAERDGDDWLLNGEKWYVTGGQHASFFIVLAVTGGEQTLFFVEKDAPGLEIVRTPRFMHDPYIDRHLELRLTDCRVPDANRVPSGGNEGAKRWFVVERLMIAARCCGAADRLLGLCRSWALEREAFGKPIAEFQGVAFPLADSLTELAAARLLTYHAAHAFDAEPDDKIVHGKVAMAKLYASEMAGRVADRAVQVFGGRGYMTEHPAERHFRELRVDRIWEGTSEIQRVIVAGGLLKRGLDPYVGWPS
ncbi:MAG TPA: acyl-CoA dehydrogenase family protein [Gaiellaceae bacterium]|nr:acyl-CoA dehydrogenase family protein [Gaiellaceae bacterium]